MKKKKLTINTLALGNIRQRRRQYMLLTLGIILAMVFSSGVLFFLSCLKSSAEENQKNINGAQDLIVLNCGEMDFSAQPLGEMVGEYGFAHILGYGCSDVGADAGVAIGWLDETATALSYQTLLDGRLPTQENELAVEKSALLRMGLGDLAVGDSFTLEVQTPDGESFAEQAESQTYILSGILRDKRQNNLSGYVECISMQRFFPAAFTVHGAQAPIGGKELRSCYLKFADRPTSLLSQINTEPGDDIYYRVINAVTEINPNVMISDNSLSFVYFTDRFTSVYLLIVLAVVLLLVSCLGIVNAFNTNLRDRKSYIGMLRAVGATRRQILSIFGREAFWLALFCAPVSVAVSYGLVRLIVLLMGDSFVFAPKLWTLAVAAFIGVICVLSAALAPLYTASRVTPVQTIRHIEIGRIMRKKRIRSQKQFDVPKLLAKRQMVFYRGKTTVITIILAAAILLSCFGFSFYGSIADEFYKSPYDYELCLNGGTIYNVHINDAAINNGFSENNRQAVQRSGYVKSVIGGKDCPINILVDELDDYLRIECAGSYNMFLEPENFTAENYLEKAFASPCEPYIHLKETFGYENYVINTSLCAFDAEQIRTQDKNVAEGKINLEKLNAGQEVIVVAPKEMGLYIGEFVNGGGSCVARSTILRDNENYLLTAENSFHAGDTLTLSALYSDISLAETEFSAQNVTRRDQTVTIGAVIYDADAAELARLGYGSDLKIFTTIEGMAHFVPDVKYKVLNVSLKEECTPETDEAMRSLLNSISMNVSQGYYYSEYEHANQQRAQNRAFFLAVTAVAILFFTACGSMVNNSITAKISESRRAIGTLRAVGASQRELFGVYIRQMLTTFGVGAAAGFGIYGLFFAGVRISNVLSPDRLDIMLSFSVWQTLVIFGVLFLICMVNLRLKLHRETKRSIVENIREL